MCCTLIVVPFLLVSSFTFVGRILSKMKLCIVDAHAMPADFLDISRRYLLALARKGIAGAYPLDPGCGRESVQQKIFLTGPKRTQI